MPGYDTQDGTILAGLIKVNQCEIRRDPAVFYQSGLRTERPETELCAS